jgi:hypothetical protein
MLRLHRIAEGFAFGFNRRGEPRFRQRRIATGITRSTASCQVGICAKPSSTTQSKRMPGMACMASVSDGSVCRHRPSKRF